jgi:hypothetical protein
MGPALYAGCQALQRRVHDRRLLVALKDWRKPRDERGALLLLAERGVLTGDLAKRLLTSRPYCGLRGRGELGGGASLRAGRRVEWDGRWPEVTTRKRFGGLIGVTLTAFIRERPAG